MDKELIKSLVQMGVLFVVLWVVLTIAAVGTWEGWL
jgi:hypothetical protein